MRFHDPLRIASDINEFNEQLLEQISAPVANKDGLVATMQRVIKLIEQWSWGKAEVQTIVATLQGHTSTVDNARSATTIETHVRSFYARVRAIVDLT